MHGKSSLACTSLCWRWLSLVAVKNPFSRENYGRIHCRIWCRCSIFHEYTNTSADGESERHVFMATLPNTQANGVAVHTISTVVAVWCARVLRQHGKSHTASGSRSSSHSCESTKRTHHPAAFSAKKEQCHCRRISNKKRTASPGIYHCVCRAESESGSERLAKAPLFVLARYIFYGFSVLNLTAFFALAKHCSDW